MLGLVLWLPQKPRSGFEVTEMGCRGLIWYLAVHEYIFGRALGLKGCLVGNGCFLPHALGLPALVPGIGTPF